MSVAIDWEPALNELLTELSDVQQAWLQLLTEKQRLLLNPTTEAALADLQEQEQALLSRLEACHQQRQELLQQSEADGQRPHSLQQLADTLPFGENRNSIQAQFTATKRQTQMLRQRNIANWVLHQRSLIHLSQMLEILATGGRLQPTYEKDKSISNGPTGVLVDEEI